MSTIKSTTPTMGDLLAKVTDPTDIAVGQQVKGTIIFLAKSECLIDISNLGLGIVRGKELYNEEYISRLKIGEEVEAQILELDNEKSMIELSFRAIGRDKVWQEITNLFDSKSTVPAKIREANRGGFLVKVHGIDGFLPASLLSPAHAIKNVGLEEKSLVNQMKKYLGQTFSVKIINISPETDSLIVSEKSVSDEIAQVKLQKYKVGDVVDATVVGAVDFGLFVRFDDDLEGLIHISEIAWKKVEDPRTDYKVGHVIKAKIVDIDPDNRINLSIKKLTPNPWIEFMKSVNPGDKFIGTVTKIVNYGAIVVNQDDIQGLCHISQVTPEGIDNPVKIYEHLKVGQKREFTILNLESDEKLYLSLLEYDLAKSIQDKLAEKNSPRPPKEEAPAPVESTEKEEAKEEEEE